MAYLLPTVDIIRHLRHRLSGLLRASGKFLAPMGDECYFSDLNDRGLACRSLGVIRESFEGLNDLEQTLATLNVMCEESLKVRSPSILQQKPADSVRFWSFVRHVKAIG
jgi:hypothetical protein